MAPAESDLRREEEEEEHCGYEREQIKRAPAHEERELGEHPRGHFTSVWCLLALSDSTPTCAHLRHRLSSRHRWSSSPGHSETPF